MQLYGPISDVRTDSHFHVCQGRRGSSDAPTFRLPQQGDEIEDFTEGLSASPEHLTAIRKAYSNAYGLCSLITGHYSGAFMPAWAQAQLLKVGAQVTTLRKWKDALERRLEAATAEPSASGQKPRRKRAD